MQQEPIDKDIESTENEGVSSRISGLGQKIIGGIEEIGGILTGDPNTAAEGEFNIEVGELREDIEEDLENSKSPDSEASDAK